VQNAVTNYFSISCAADRAFGGLFRHFKRVRWPSTHNILFYFIELLKITIAATCGPRMNLWQLEAMNGARMFEVSMFADSLCQRTPILHVASVADGHCKEVDQDDSSAYVIGHITGVNNKNQLKLDVFQESGCMAASHGATYEFTCCHCQPMTIFANGKSQTVYYSAKCA
jgi:hypothetical protein